MGNSIGKHLMGIIQAGDSVLSVDGDWHRVKSKMVRRRMRGLPASYIVPCYVDCFIMPIHAESIKAVKRDGIIIYEVGKTPIQRELFS